MRDPHSARWAVNRRSPVATNPEVPAVGSDLNPNPLDKIGRYGMAWMITELFGFTRRDLAVYLGVYWSDMGSGVPVSGRKLAASRIPRSHHPVARAS